MTTLDPLQQLLDRDAIRDVLNRYCRSIDRADAAALASAYHPDAQETHGNHTGDAAAFRSRAVRNTQERFLRMHHSLGTINIDLAGDVAYSEAYFAAGCVLRPAQDHKPMITVLHGRYLDRFERRDGAWKIAKRTVVKDYRDVRAVDDPPEQYPLGDWGALDPLYSMLLPAADIAPGRTDLEGDP